MHERIVVNEVCFPETMSLDAEIACWQRLGVDRVGLANFKVPGGDWDVSIGKLNAAGIAAGYLLHASMYQLDRPETWDASTNDIRRTIDAAVALGTPTVYTTTGPRGTLSFEQASSALVEAAAPAVTYAEQRGVRLLVETANPIFADLHFLHTFADTAEVAAAAGLGLCLDIHAVWTEPALRRSIESRHERIGLVQVSDYTRGTRTAFRDPPGDGIIPLEEIMGWLLEQGYNGLFDLEIFGQAANTAEEGTARGINWLTPC